jgi:chemotaxis protein MotB
MARKKRAEERENHERWLVSYADFITLLFAFFVVMYSISSVNEGKYRVLSDSLVTAFREPERSLEPVQFGELMRAPMQSKDMLDGSGAIIEVFKMTTAEGDKSKAQADTGQHKPETNGVDKGVQTLADSIEASMADLVGEGMIKVRRDKRWIEVEIKSSILFESGSAALSAPSTPVLRELAEKFRTLDNVIHVEGFTDNVPINNFEFLSNWELSAARAASVVHLFTRLGIAPMRLAAIGYGEYRPVASNDTAEGRAKNRRVVLVIMSGSDARVSQRLDHLQTWREGPPAPLRTAPDVRPATATAARPAS